MNYTVWTVRFLYSATEMYLEPSRASVIELCSGSIFAKMFECVPKTSLLRWGIYSEDYSNHSWKVSKYGVLSGPYFPVFGLNTGNYGPEKTPYLKRILKVVSIANNNFLSSIEST